MRAVQSLGQAGGRLSGAPEAGGDTQVAVAGSWRNELGSLLRLAGAPGGGLTGTYESAVGAPPGEQPVVGLHGITQPDGSLLLGFVVRWPVVGSIAVWTGRYEPDADRIVATWLLVHESEPGDAWRSTSVGSDEFRREAGPGR